MSEKEGIFVLKCELSEFLRFLSIIKVFEFKEHKKSPLFGTYDMQRGCKKSPLGKITI